MKSEDLIRQYIGIFSEKDYNELSLKVYANIADLNKDGYIIKKIQFNKKICLNFFHNKVYNFR
jgi:hypothetical protein